jgi:hypothetical protein
VKPVAMSSTWTEVFAGPAWKAELLKGELEERGIPTFAPDANIQTIDPFMRVGQVFDLHVLVPHDRSAEALAVIAECSQDAPLPPDATDDDTPPADAELKRLEAVGRRIRWSAIVGMFAPYGLWLAASYVPAATRQTVRPGYHHWTLFAIAMCGFETIAWVAIAVFAR